MSTVTFWTWWKVEPPRIWVQRAKIRKKFCWIKKADIGNISLEIPWFRFYLCGFLNSVKIWRASSNLLCPHVLTRVCANIKLLHYNNINVRWILMQRRLMSLNMAPMFQNLMTHKVYTVFFVAKAKKCFDKFNLQYVVIPGVGGWKYVWWYFMAKNQLWDIYQRNLEQWHVLFVRTTRLQLFQKYICQRFHIL